MIRRIAILGATGSIGTQTLDILARYPDRFSACCLCARSDADGLFQLARRFHPRTCGLVIEPKEIPADLRGIEWFFGEDSASRALAASGADDALCAVVGIAGLDAVLTALDTCERVLLANKEALVTGGHLVTEKAKHLHRTLLPVDSEHSAIYQCLQAARGNVPTRLILTCSGGALREFPRDRLAEATVSDVLKHPTWRMGSKITVDCATLMNKGLEVIEAYHLFGLPEEKIEVVIHPQSVIHSMVEFADGAVLAQLGAPDMRVPIGYALGEPDRLAFGGERLDFTRMGALTFASPDTERFPCLAYAREALRLGGAAPVVLNGANEEAVAAFLERRIRFDQIHQVNLETLAAVAPSKPASLGDLLAIDAQGRAAARQAITRLAT